MSLDEFEKTKATASRLQEEVNKANELVKAKDEVIEKIRSTEVQVFFFFFFFEWKYIRGN